MFTWFRKLERRTRRAHRARRSFQRWRPCVESLESRRLLTVTASVDATGHLNVKISGTDTAVIAENSDREALVEDSTGTVVFDAGPAQSITGIFVTSTGVNDTTDLTQVGKSTDFTKLATVSIGAGTGAQTLLSGSISTSSDQTYATAVTLEGDTTLTSTGGNLAFDSTVDGGFQLNTSANTTTFGGEVGGKTVVTILSVNAGTADLNGGSIHTSGRQTYGSAVVLTADTTLTSDTGDIGFFGAVDSGAGGPFSLTANSPQAIFFGGPVGQTAPLSSLTTTGSGATTIDVSVATTGLQAYEQPVLLSGNVTLDTQGGNVTFAGTVDSASGDGSVTPFSLTIDTTGNGTAANAGQTQFAGNVGASAALSTFSVTTGGPFILSHQVITNGNVLIAVAASPPSPRDSLTVASGGAITTEGNVELRSGGDLAIDAGASITSPAVTLRGDFNNAAVQNTVLLAGNIQSPTIAVFVGNGNGTVNVAKTLANTATTVTGGSGTDTFNLSSAAPGTAGVLSTLAGALTLDGGSGSNALVLGDAADASGLPGTLTASVITGFGMANGIRYADLQSVVFQLSSAVGETLSIQGTASGTAVAVNGGHTVIVGGAPGGLDQILSSLAINGAAVLEVNDQQTTTGHTYDISSGSLVRTGASNLAPINDAALPGQIGIALTNVPKVVVTAGPQGDLFNVFLPVPPGRTVVLQGGGGADNDLNVIGGNTGPNTAYVGNIGSGDPIQIGGIDCLTMYGAPNQPNAFVNQTAVPSILIGGLHTDTLVGGSGPDVLFGGAGNDLLIAGGTAGSPGIDYTFADLLPAYLPNGTLNTNVSDPTVYPGLPGAKFINGGGGVVVYFNNGTGVANAASVTFMECDLPGSRALLQSIFNQALAVNPCLATLTSAPAPPAALTTLATLADDSPFVQHAFEAVLGRTADPASLSYWTAELAGGMSRATFAGILSHSDEYYRRLVATDYETYLGRAAAAADIDFWADQFEQGMSDQTFESLLLGSNEFFARSGGNGAWINAVYELLLGRAANDQDEQYWSGRLQAGESRTAIAQQIAGSPEADAQVVIADYQRYLGRSPASAEINYWVDQLQSGLTNEDVIAGFVASNEFFFAS